VAEKTLAEIEQDIIDSIVKAGKKARKDPKGKARTTTVHRDRTKYTRKGKHEEQ